MKRLAVSDDAVTMRRVAEFEQCLRPRRIGVQRRMLRGIGEHWLHLTDEVPCDCAADAALVDRRSTSPATSTGGFTRLTIGGQHGGEVYRCLDD